ncbi:MAG TPA: zinc ribbon domain-containing protein [Polyangia bacterium]|nr:zinc ribbon domain-containing protein [Polyangia bacterium]
MSAKTVTAEAKGQRATSAPQGPGDAAAPARARRRVPGWAAALVGAALAVGYGAGLERLQLGPPLVMLALGGMTLALCGLALWRVIDPLTRSLNELGGTRESNAPGRARELEREKQLVLKAIKEIELDHQMRKIADADYREMIARYRTRAMRLISEIEVGDNFRELIERELKDRLAIELSAPADTGAATSAKTATTTAPTPAVPAQISPSSCAACGTVNDPDAQFCKKCGVKLAA